MKRTFSTQQWSRRRTEALLDRFKTQAPSDFHAQVLVRVHERQPLSAASPGSQDSITGRWQQLYAWLRETRSLKPRCTTLATAAGSVCTLLLAGALLWWTCVQGGGGPPPEAGSVAGVPSPEIPEAHHDERLAGATDYQAPQSRVAKPPALADTGLPHTLQRTTDDPAAAGDITIQKQVLLPPTISVRQRANDPPPMIKTEPQRVHAKRAIPTKPKRVRKGQGMGKHVSA